MTTLALNYFKVQERSLPQVNWNIVCFTGFFISLALLIFYVWQINDLTRGSYSVNNYEKEIKELSNENKSLQISFAESDFLGQVLIKTHALNFQKVTSVKYIQILDSPVAAAKK